MKTILTPDEAAEMLLTSPETLARWRRVGLGPKFIRVGRNIRYQAADLTVWLSAVLIRQGVARRVAREVRGNG